MARSPVRLTGMAAVLLSVVLVAPGPVGAATHGAVFIDNIAQAHYMWGRE